MDGSNSIVYKPLVKKLVRYVLACESARKPIRRDGIKELLGEHSRAFKEIFNLAQGRLRDVFGMELRELPIREKVTLQERRQAMKSNNQSRSGSGSYVVSSTLPEAYRNAIILEPSKTPTADQEAAHMGIYTLLVSLIWLNGGQISEQQMQRYLARLNAERMLAREQTEVVLKRLQRQGYLVKKVDQPPVGYAGDQTITWLVGPRAKDEVGLDGVMGMVREVYGHPEDPAFEKKLRTSLGLSNTQEDGDGDVNMADGK